MRRLLILALVLLLCLPLSVISAGASPVDGYTSALEDLSSCEGFSQAKYPPINSKEYATIKVIHVAESEDNQLFVYVYQPSAENIPLVASKVSIGITNTGEPGSYDLYDLILLSQDGVFQKYLVKDFLVSDAEQRYYDIPCIYRPFDPTLDAAPTDDNTVDGIGIEVGFMWTYSGAGENYTAERQEVITVTAEHAGFIRYDKDLLFYAAGKDAHYIAFNTDKNIDDLLSADITYKMYRAEKYHYAGYPQYDKTTVISFPDEDMTLQHEDILVKYGIFGNSSAKYDRIQTVEEFKSSENLTDATTDALKNCKWVLRFLETDYKYVSVNNAVVPNGSIIPAYTMLDVETYSKVEKVTILRLSFMDHGVQYNMGVVANIVSGDDVPDNETNGVPDWFITLLIVLAILVLLVLLWVLSIVAPVLKPAFKALIWILLLPFKLLWWLIKAIWNWIQKE